MRSAWRQRPRQAVGFTLLLLALVVTAVVTQARVGQDDDVRPTPVEGRLQVGRIEATSDQVIRGLRITNPDGPCIYLSRGVKNVVIEDNEIGPCGTTVEHVGIEMQPGTGNVTVRNNEIHDVASGLFATHAQNPIVFEGNRTFDIRGPAPRGQMIQLDSVEGGTGQSRISNNVSDRNARTATTRYEDHISIHGSSGTAATPILVSCNKIRGGDSKSGAGILVGDSGGGWVTVVNNVMVLTSNTGIGVPGGHDVRVLNNKIYNAGDDAQSYTEGVAYVMAQGDQVPTDVLFHGNRGLSRAWISGHGEYHDGLWDDGTGVNISYDNNNWEDHSLTETIWDQPIEGCS